MGVAGGAVLIATYPARAKARNIRRTGPRPCSSSRTSSTARGSRSTVRAEVVDLPDAEDALVDYFRVISGEHPDWDEYRRAMREQGKCLLRVAIDAWGPIATGGFPPDVAARMT